MKLNDLEVKPLFNGRCYVLLSDFKYQINDYVITVPKGFVTDLASVPRAFWSIFPPFGKYTVAAVVHDFLYSEYNNTNINRTLADEIFIFIMKENGVSFVKRQLMFRAVRTFGSMAWKKKTVVEEQPYQDRAVFDYTNESKAYYEIMRKKLGL